MTRLGAPLSSEISAYGKLPVARDFVWRNCSEGARRAFRTWLDEAGPRLEGIKGWKRLLFRIRPGRASLPLIGTLWPSSDAGGLRPFPFALFTEAGSAATQGAALEHEFRIVAEVFESARARLLAQSSETAMAGLLETLQFDRTRVPALTQEPIPLAAWVADVHGADPDAFPLGLWRLRQARPAARPGRPNLLLPLSTKTSVAAQVGAWTHVCHEAQWPHPLGILALEHAVERPRLLLTTEEAPPSALESFFGPAGEATINLFERSPTKNLDGFRSFESRISQPGLDLRAIGPNLIA